MQNETEMAPEGACGVQPLWSVAALARYLGRSQRWVWAQLGRPASEVGSIPHRRIGKAPRFIPEEIQRWVDAGCPPVAQLQAWRGRQ